ncbi:hypothetical protein C3L33_04367, partial [Rhododendron williamsianum]
MGRRRSSPVNKMFAWVRSQSMKVKTFLAVTAVLCSLVALKLLIRDHNHFFVASEAIHAAGILVLIYKLTTQKTCSGLSLKTQELTALFLAVRLYCSFVMEGDIHTVLDFATLVSTAWVLYMIRFKLKSSYIAELDNLPLYYMVIPSAILAILIHPYTQHSTISKMMWAFCVYLESVSVLPQLRLIQNAKVNVVSQSSLLPAHSLSMSLTSNKNSFLLGQMPFFFWQMVEPFTAHYVFALGVARFLGCAHWILQVSRQELTHHALVSLVCVISRVISVRKVKYIMIRADVVQ